VLRVANLENPNANEIAGVSSNVKAEPVVVDRCVTFYKETKNTMK